MLSRSTTLVRALALSLIALGPTVSPALPQSPVTWQASSIPVLVPGSAGDPYALDGSANGGVITAGGPWLLGGTAAAGQPAIFSTSSLITGSRFFPTGPEYPSRLWILGEYLLWGTDGMDVPALVTTSPPGTPRDQAAILGEPGTAILFGAGELNGSTVSGFRVGGGYWITPQQTFAIEGEYFRLGEQDDRFRGGSNGTTIIGRPFFDILAGRETAQLVSFPGVLGGAISVDTESNLQSAMINARAALCPAHGNACNCGRRDRIDWIVGYRFIELKDNLAIHEDLTSLVATAPGTIQVSDQFRTTNRFNGLQLGAVHRANFKRAWLESLLRVALGGNKQTVRISGNTVITEAGVTDSFNGGLLAQRTNIGQWQRGEFVMVPEVGVKLGLRFTKRLHATVGYTALYLPNVVRAGNQIDTDVNPNLIAPEVDPFTGAPRPRFRFVESDYWAHGLTVGGELRF